MLLPIISISQKHAALKAVEVSAREELAGHMPAH
jgi:hypothetical protein